MVNRWLILGTVTVLSPLQIRTGEKESDSVGSALAIEADANGFPFIPGSSFKGAVCTRIAAVFDKGRDFKLLLGSEPYRGAGRSPDRDPETRLALGGRAEFLDCRVSGDAKTADMGPTFAQTRIGRKSRTADDATLRTARAVAPGTVFDAEIMIDRASTEDVTLLLAGLFTLDGGAQSTLGGGAGIGRGVCKFDLTAIHCMDAAAILSWMQSDAPAHWRKEIRRHRIRDAERDSLSEQARTRLGGAPALSTDITATVKIVFDSPFLIAGRADKTKKSDSDDRDADLNPLEYERDKPILPGSSLRGALRSQAERIVRTVHPDGAEPHPLIVELFGDTGRRGALSFGDFTLTGDAALEKQEFVAIDRFTGGARDGAKFSIKAAQQPVFKGQVTLRNSDGLSHAARGLLLLLWRDVKEGDVTIGHGANKGFARSRVGRAPCRLARDEASAKAFVGAFRHWNRVEQPAKAAV